MISEKKNPLSPSATNSSSSAEDSTPPCCRVIHLSEREYLLLRRYDKHKNWLQRLNPTLHNMRIFLLRSSWEIHVRGACHSDRARKEILTGIRRASTWWALLHPEIKKCVFFPDCQLNSTDTNCKRISISDKDHGIFLLMDKKSKMTAKLNVGLKHRNLSICLLKQRPDSTSEVGILMRKTCCVQFGEQLRATKWDKRSFRFFVN